MAKNSGKRAGRLDAATARALDTLEEHELGACVNDLDVARATLEAAAEGARHHAGLAQAHPEDASTEGLAGALMALADVAHDFLSAEEHLREARRTAPPRRQPKAAA